MYVLVLISGRLEDIVERSLFAVEWGAVNRVAVDPSIGLHGEGRL